MKNNIYIYSTNKLYLLFLLLFSFFSSYCQENSNTKTNDNQLNIKLSGRVHYDLEFLNQDNETEDYSLNGQEFRQLFLGASGTISENIRFKTEFDLSGGKIGMRDVYLKMIDLPFLKGNLIIGNQAEPTGMDMLTGGNFVPFMERTSMSATQNFRWNTGFGYENFNVLQKNIGLQLTYCFNGNKDDAFTDTHLENGKHIVGRIFYPFNIKSNNQFLLHIGTHIESRERTDKPTDYTLKLRPENHMGFQISLPFLNLESQQDFGFEMASQWKKFIFQSEFESANFKSTDKTRKVNSFYALISCFLTNDSKKYKDGVFGNVSPIKPLNFKNKTWGAVEVLTRFSNTNFSDIVLSDYDNKITNISLGLNWYLNSNTRFMYNFVYSDFNKTYENPKLNAHLFRFQVFF